MSSDSEFNPRYLIVLAGSVCLLAILIDKILTFRKNNKSILSTNFLSFKIAPASTSTEKRSSQFNPALDETEAPFVLKLNPVSNDFMWNQELPRPYRPYKSGKYNMTMGMKSLPHDDLLIVDNEYMKITNEKARVGETECAHTVLTLPEVNYAVEEIYDFLIDYMVQRFPKYFFPYDPTNKTCMELISKYQLEYNARPESQKRYKFPENSITKEYSVNDQDKFPLLYNGIRNEFVPLNAKSYIDYCNSHPGFEIDKNEPFKNLIRAGARTVAEDFLMLQYEEKTEQYYLKSGSFSFPSGFDPAMKVGLPLSQIHAPVPFYKERIQSSMDKYFKRVKVGVWIERLNWSVQTHTNLYAAGLNHPQKNESVDATEYVSMEPLPNYFFKPEKSLPSETLDFTNQVHLRVERQALFRLPKCKFIVFTIKTYLTPLSQIRDHEPAKCSEELISAIQNLPPQTRHYKVADKWGDAVISYLSRETEGKVAA